MVLPVPLFLSGGFREQTGHTSGLDMLISIPSSYGMMAVLDSLVTLLVVSLWQKQKKGCVDCALCSMSISSK